MIATVPRVNNLNCFYVNTPPPNVLHYGRGRGGLMVSVLDSGSSGPGSGPGRRHCVVFLGKTLYSHGASLRMDTGEFNASVGGIPALD